MRIDVPALDGEHLSREADARQIEQVAHERRRPVRRRDDALDVPAGLGAELGSVEQAVARQGNRLERVSEVVADDAEEERLEVLDVLPLDRVADGARQEGVIGLALHEVLLRPGAHARERGVEVGLSAQHDNRQVRVVAREPLERLEPVGVGQAQVEEDNLDVAALEAGHGGLERRDPLHDVRARDRVAQDLAKEARVRLVVFDQKDANAAHSAPSTFCPSVRGGRRTTVIQKSWIVCTTRMNCSRSTGLVMKQFVWRR